jgi:hypothetical protein
MLRRSLLERNVELMSGPNANICLFQNSGGPCIFSLWVWGRDMGLKAMRYKH